MVQTPVSLTPKDYKSEVKPTWCPGCGDFGVLNATYRGMAGLKMSPDQTVVVSGIGCSSRFPHFMKTFGFHSVHGRALPVAQGLKMARPDLTVVAVGGDGDFFSIGAGHLLHAALRNIDITVIVMDNESVEPETHALFERMAREGDVSVIPYPSAFNWSAINNLAARRASDHLLDELKKGNL